MSSDVRKATTPPLVPDYDLLRRIGHGAYGDVWLARSQATGVLRAAKIVWRHTFEDDRPFKREFEGIQRFEQISREHPGQLSLFHIGRNEAEGYFYYVMELADPIPVAADVRRLTAKESEARNPKSDTKLEPPDVGCYAPRTLRADLEYGRLPAARVLEIGLILTEALGHLHKNGLVHRDVKPSNVIFVNGRPKLADIGLVTDASDQCSIVGTEGYLPPEGPGTPQADIFALGKVLYEAATGLDRREFPKIPDDIRGWPDAKLVFELNEIILRACAQEVNERYENCDEMHAELGLLDQGRSVRHKRTRQQRWAVAKRVMAALAVIGVFAMCWALLWQEPRSAHPLSKNPEAMKLYNQSVYLLHSGTLDRHLEAFTNLLEAVKRDPKFVDAYYMMLEAFFAENMPPYYNQLTNSQWVATKLKELNPNSVQYHTANSLVKFLEWKFDEAIDEAALAKQIDPSFVRAHGLYAWYMLLARGDAETALREYRIAEKLDPSDVTIQIVMAQPFIVERKFDLAIRQLNDASSLEPRINVHYDLAQAYEANGQYDMALDEYETNTVLIGYDPIKTKESYDRMRSELKAKGARGWWQAEVDGSRTHPPDNPWWSARFYAHLGYTNEAIALLNQAYTNHDDNLTTLLVDDCWDSIRNDPQFKDLLKKIGLRPKSVP